MVNGYSLHWGIWHSCHIWPFYGTFCQLFCNPLKSLGLSHSLPSSGCVYAAPRASASIRWECMVPYSAMSYGAIYGHFRSCQNRIHMLPYMVIRDCNVTYMVIHMVPYMVICMVPYIVILPYMVTSSFSHTGVRGTLNYGVRRCPLF